MTDEDTPQAASSHPENAPDLTDKKGQMLVIYLPEGSVIVDRTDINLSSAPKAVVEQVETKAEPTNEVEKVIPQPLQPTLEEVVQLAVQEVLKITGHPQGEMRKAEAPVPVAERQAATAQHPEPRGAQRVHVRRRRKLNWVHGVNTLLVAYLLMVSIVPAVLSSAFGMAIHASKAAYPGALIAKGDLMVSTILPASQLKVNDVLLVRDGNSWRLDARQVTSVTTNGDLSTVTTASTGGAVVDKTYVLPKDGGTYKVSRVIPELGYIPIVLSSMIVKVMGGLFILVLNLVVHYRRLPRRRLELAK